MRQVARAEARRRTGPGRVPATGRESSVPAAVADPFASGGPSAIRTSMCVT